MYCLVDSLGSVDSCGLCIVLWWLGDLCPTDWEVLGLWQLKQGHHVEIPAWCGLC